MQAYPTCISKDAISELPLAFFPGSIVVVETDLQVEKALAFLSMQRLVGFDTETKPVFSKGKKNKVALMQVATEDVCFLFRLNTIGLSDAINDFLGDAAIKKIGLSLRDDFLMLRARNAALKTEGFIDLQDVAKTLGITDSSLQKIYALLFGEKISKSQRLSNWEATQLTTGQQNYAALDAYACLKIYRKLSAGNLVFVPNSEESVGDE